MTDNGQIKKETKTIVNPDTNETKYQMTDYVYDSLGQVTQKKMSEQAGSTTSTLKVADIQYDEIGRMVKETSVADGKKTENRYYYDHNNNILHSRRGSGQQY